MAIDDRERERRRRYLGSSDTPALFGAHRYRSLGDIYLEKTQDFVPFDEFPSDEAEAGTFIEQGTLAWASRKLDVEIVPNQRFERGIFACNTDGVIMDASGTKPVAVVECKATSDHTGWKEELTDEIPPDVLLQTTQQMMVTGASVGYVAVLVIKYRGYGYRLYKVEYEAALVKEIIERGEAFWDCVTRRIVPEEPPRMDTIKEIKRTPGKVVTIPAKAVVEYEQYRRARLALEKLEDASKAYALALLGDAEEGHFDGGRLEYHKIVRREKAREAREITYRRPAVKFDKGVTLAEIQQAHQIVGPEVRAHLEGGDRERRGLDQPLQGAGAGEDED